MNVEVCILSIGWDGLVLLRDSLAISENPAINFEILTPREACLNRLLCGGPNVRIKMYRIILIKHVNYT